MVEGHPHPRSGAAAAACPRVGLSLLSLLSLLRGRPVAQRVQLFDLWSRFDVVMFLGLSLMHPYRP